MNCVEPFVFNNYSDSPTIGLNNDDLQYQQVANIMIKLFMANRCICNSNTNLFYYENCMHMICEYCVDAYTCPLCKTPGSATLTSDNLYKIRAHDMAKQLKKIGLQGEESVVTFFAPHVFDIKKTHNGETILHKNCRENNVIALKEYLQRGADPNEQDFAGWTPLHEAVLKGNLDAAKLLLEYGALVNVPAHKRFYETPILSALLQGKLEMIELLVKHGADLSSISDRGYSVFDFCDNYDKFRTLCLCTRNDINYQVFTIPPPTIAFLMEQTDHLLIKAVSRNDTVSFRKLSDLDKPGEVNYLIMHTSQPNNKYVQLAILQGVLIVNINWVLEFVVKGTKINPMNYIAQFEGFSLKKSALNMFYKRPKLFSELYFHFMIKTNSVIVNNCKYNMEDLKQLVIAGDGNILKRRPHVKEGEVVKFPYHTDKNSKTASTNFYTIYNGPADTLKESNIEGIRVRSIKWFITCINTFTIIPHPI